MTEETGLLLRLQDWLDAGPQPGLRRVRTLLVGHPGPRVEALAEHADGGLLTLPSGGPAAAATALVDREVDAGCDLLLLATPRADPVAAVAGIAVYAGEEPVRALGFDATLPDEEWMRRLVAVREGMRRVDRSVDLAGALQASGDPGLATAAATVDRAVGRRTPIVLDGLTALAGAILVSQHGDLDTRLLLVAATDDHPAAALALRVLGLRPVLDLGRLGGDGVAALVVLGLLRAAAALGPVPQPFQPVGRNTADQLNPSEDRK